MKALSAYERGGDHRIWLEAVDLGIDVMLGKATALRVEGSLLASWDGYDPFALIATLSLAHSFE